MAARKPKSTGAAAAKGQSAGLLLYRLRDSVLEVLLVHPGGPFWKNKDEGAWMIPKGLIADGEDPLAAACREFAEETGLAPQGPYLPLGSIQQKAGKVVHAWACQGDADAQALKSNTMRLEYPRGSGRWLTIPEVDRYEWLDPDAARRKINPAQIAFLDRLAALLAAGNSSP